MQETYVNNILEVTLDSIQEIFETVSTTSKFFTNINARTWVFRGHSLSNWALLPSVFRDHIRQEYNFADFDTLKYIIENEFRLLHDFITLSNHVGLQIPEDGYRYIQYPKTRYENFTDVEYLNFPRENLFSILALAQHHGIPTRLLDFSYDPLSALYFAADHNNNKNDNDFMVIFCLNRKEIILNSARFEFVYSPNYSNEYLKNQKGLFIIDREINNRLKRNEKLHGFDLSIIEEYESFVGRLNIDKTKYHTNFIIKLKIPEKFRSEILINLNNMFYNKAFLMPTFDNVTSTLKSLRKLGIMSIF